MNRTVVPMWSILLIACGCAIAFALRTEREGRSAAAAANDESARVELAVRALERDRIGRPEWLDRPAPDAELTRRVAAALNLQGLPPSTLASVEPDSPIAVGRLGDPQRGPLAKRARATVSLRGLTLPQLGLFLEAWGERERQWSIASVRLEPERVSRPARSSTGASSAGAGMVSSLRAGDDLPLSVVLVLECLHIDGSAMNRAALEAGIELPTAAIDGSRTAGANPAAERAANAARLNGTRQPDANKATSATNSHRSAPDRSTPAGSASSASTTTAAPARARPARIREGQTR